MQQVYLEVKMSHKSMNGCPCVQQTLQVLPGNKEFPVSCSASARGRPLWSDTQSFHLVSRYSQGSSVFICWGKLSAYTECFALLIIIWPQMECMLLISLPDLCLNHSLVPAYSLPAVSGIINTLPAFVNNVWFVWPAFNVGAVVNLKESLRCV